MKLLLYIFVFLFLLLGIIFFITGRLLCKSDQNFKKNKRYGKAEVIGYDREENSDWHSLSVRLCGNDADGKAYNCTAKKINIADYPKGKIVEVVYAPKKLMGSLWYDIRLNEEGKLPTEDGIISRVLIIIGSICLILAVVLFIVSLLL